MSHAREIEQMKSWEQRFQAATGFADRSFYKIFYGLIRPAPILLLGINPGGSPDTVSVDGTLNLKNNSPAAASASYYENGESDLLDCSWPENQILKLVRPIASEMGISLRNQVVKTNVAFHRSSTAPRKTILAQMELARPILSELVELVSPKLIILSGDYVHEFVNHHCRASKELATLEKETSVGQTAIWPWEITLNGKTEKTLLVQVASASQFSWIYGRHDVARRTIAYWKQLAEHSE